MSAVTSCCQMPAQTEPSRQFTANWKDLHMDTDQDNGHHVGHGFRLPVVSIDRVAQSSSSQDSLHSAKDANNLGMDTNQDSGHHVGHGFRVGGLLLAEAAALLHAGQVEVLHPIGVMHCLAGAQSDSLLQSLLQHTCKQLSAL